MYRQSEKNLLNSNTSSACSDNTVNLGPTSGWDLLASLGHPCKFQRVSRLGSITARHSSSGRQQILRRWTEGATYIRQGGHHVGHWPTFLVGFLFVQLQISQQRKKIWVWTKHCLSHVGSKFVKIVPVCFQTGHYTRQPHLPLVFISPYGCMGGYLVYCV